MTEVIPTCRSRGLGYELRCALLACRMTQQRLAEMIGWNPSTVARLLLGERRAKEPDLAAVLALLGIRGRRRDYLLGLGRESYTQTWLQEYDGCLPVTPHTLAEHEASTRTISVYEPTVIPELLQTREYARALITASPILPGHDTEDRIATRMKRQRVLFRREAPRLNALLAESALYNAVGDEVTMIEQRHHLMKVAARPNVTIRLVPDSFGPQTTITNGFTLLESAKYSSIVCLQSDTTSLFLEKRQHVDTYRTILAALERVALDVEQSSWRLNDEEFVTAV